MKILAFAASNSSESINRRLALHVARRVPGADVESLNIDDYEMPIFSEQREMVLGQPEPARAFYKRLGQADALVISYAEHNGTYTAAWKNLLDWTSRIERRFFQHKPALFLSASPGAGGASNVLETAAQSAPHFGARLVSQISVPHFGQQYDSRRDRMADEFISAQIQRAVARLEAAVNAGDDGHRDTPGDERANSATRRTG